MTCGHAPQLVSLPQRDGRRRVVAPTASSLGRHSLQALSLAPER